MNPVAPVIAMRIATDGNDALTRCPAVSRTNVDYVMTSVRYTGCSRAEARRRWNPALGMLPCRAAMDGFEATRFLLVCLGGAVGTGARYLVQGWALGLLGPQFPYGTLTVNVLGSMLLGVIMQLGVTTDLLSPTARVTLATGVMGGFTTYSTFNYETLRYCQEGAWSRALLNVVATLLLCALAGVAGLALARRIAGA